MANLTEKDIKKGVLKGTNSADSITIDSNYSGKKVTVKAGNGNDTVSAEEFGGALHAYAGLGSDTLCANDYTNYLYGESGTNTFVINSNADATTISAGKGKAIIDFSSIQGLGSSFFNNINNFTKVKNDLQITIPENITGNVDTMIIIKDFYKQRGEFIALHEYGEFDLRDLNLTTNIAGSKSASYTGGRLSETINGDYRKNTIKGGDGNDIIIGGDGNDKLYGDTGNDTINGVYGNDTIYGGDGNDSLGSDISASDYGNDVIYGGNGNDTLNGGMGADKLYGGSGTNTYFVDLSDNDTIYVEKDSESNVRLDLKTDEITKSYRSKNDWILENNDGGKLTIANYFKNGCPTVNLQYNNGNDFTNVPDYIEYSKKGTIKGTNKSDRLIGSKYADKIYTNGSKDVIYAGKGNDKIYNTANSNSFLYFNNGDGKDTIYGKFEQIIMDNSVAPNLFTYQKSGNNLIIKYNNGKDAITLSDYFLGEAFGIIDGMNISNYLNSRLTVSKGCGNVKFYSMPDGANTIEYQGTLNLDFVDFKKSGNDLVIFGFGGKKDKITIVDYYKDGFDIEIKDSTGYIGTLNEIIDYYFNLAITEQGIPDGDFSIYSDYDWTYKDIYNTNDNIKFGYGNDKITTGHGHDTINTGDGNDTVNAGSGNDYIITEGGKNKIYAGAGNDTIDSSMEDDIIYGGDGNDIIIEYGGNDKIYGDKGNDTIDADDGNDIVDGGAGNDKINGGDGSDTIYGGAGNDTIDGDGNNDYIKAGSGDDSITVGNDDTIYGEAGNDVLNFADSLTGAYIDLGSGNDSISGLSNNITDITLKAGSGNDVFIFSNINTSDIDMGTGNDTLYVIAQNLDIKAGSGNDQITFTGHSSEIDCGSGNDTLTVSGSTSLTEVEGGSGNDFITVSKGNVEIDDSSGNDTYVVKNMTVGNQVIIDDSKGKDSLALDYDKDELSFNIGIKVDSKGKIVNMKDTDVNITSSENGYVKIDDYFGSGCIERIETADGYYVTKVQLDNVAQEVAAWLTSNGFGSTSYAYNDGDSNQIMELNAIFENINWQK